MCGKHQWDQETRILLERTGSQKYQLLKHLHLAVILVWKEIFHKYHMIASSVTVLWQVQKNTGFKDEVDEDLWPLPLRYVRPWVSARSYTDSILYSLHVPGRCYPRYFLYRTSLTLSLGQFSYRDSYHLSFILFASLLSPQQGVEYHMVKAWLIKSVK